MDQQDQPVGLTPRFIRKIREVIEDVVSARINARPNYDPAIQPQLAPECYVVKTPSSGIPKRKKLRPGRAFCKVYKLVPVVHGSAILDLQPVLLQNGQHYTRLIYNLSEEKVTAEYVRVNREKYGVWVVDCPCGVAVSSSSEPSSSDSDSPSSEPSSSEPSSSEPSSSDDPSGSEVSSIDSSSDTESSSYYSQSTCPAYDGCEWVAFFHYPGGSPVLRWKTTSGQPNACAYIGSSYAFGNFGPSCDDHPMSSSPPTPRCCCDPPSSAPTFEGEIGNSDCADYS